MGGGLFGQKRDPPAPAPEEIGGGIGGGIGGRRRGRDVEPKEEEKKPDRFAGMGSGTDPFSKFDNYNPLGGAEKEGSMKFNFGDQEAPKEDKRTFLDDLREEPGYKRIM